MQLNSSSTHDQFMQEDMGDYVAHLQLHMSLQAKNLVPNFSATPDGRQTLLEETQATVEKQVSRQVPRI